MSLWDILNSIFVNLWNMITQVMLKKSSDDFKIYVKTSEGSTVPVVLTDGSSVGDIKKVVCNKLGTSEQDIRIIFSGRELQDTTILKDCDLGNQSTLHAVKKRNDKDSAVVARHSATAKIRFPSLPISFEHDSDVRRVHFFVYCNTCQSLEQGKLRVRCGKCKSGAFTVNTDPSCWDDVLIGDKITGVCSEKNCEGTFANFYFKCSAHVTQGESDEAIPLRYIKPNVNGMPCLTCMDIRSPIFEFSCPAGHLVCVDCFVNYCSIKLRERQFLEDFECGYTTNCPIGCSDSLVRDIHHFKLMGQELYQRYHQFGAEEFVLQSGGVLCPQVNCGMGLLPESSCRRIVCENGCNYVFCRDCLEGYHLGECTKSYMDCSENTSSQVKIPSLSEWDKASKVMIQITTKPCPSCRTPTERSGGCMHMICIRPQCKFEWCWVCQTDWTRDCMASHWFG